MTEKYVGRMDKVWFVYEKPVVVFHWDTNEAWGFRSEADAQKHFEGERVGDPYAIFARMYAFESGDWNLKPWNQ